VVGCALGADATMTIGRDVQMAIHIDSCAAQDTIIVTTRSSVYELIVLRGDRGDVLVRGGSHFTEFRRVLFLGSAAAGGALEPHTVDIGLRMTFGVDDRVVITSEVQSLSRGPATATPTDCKMKSHDAAFSRPDAVREDAMSASRLHGPAPANEK
jgi:hypothetical protein